MACLFVGEKAEWPKENMAHSLLSGIFAVLDTISSRVWPRCQRDKGSGVLLEAMSSMASTRSKVVTTVNQPNASCISVYSQVLGNAMQKL